MDVQDLRENLKTYAIIGVLFFGIVACATVGRGLVGRTFEYEGETMNNRTVSQADFEGKVVLIDFFATWCGPCMSEVPELENLYAAYSGQGFEIVGVSLDRDERQLSRWIEGRQIPWTIIYPGRDIASSVGVPSIPRYMVIDKNGVVRDADARRTYKKLIPELLRE